MGFGTYLMDIFGPTKAEKSAMDALNSSSGVAVQQGEGDTTAASKWYQDILSGDPTKQAQAIAPQTAAAQEGAQQQKNQAAQFAQTTANEAPFLSAGTTAIGELQGLTGTNAGGNPLTAPLTKQFQPTMAQLAATPGYQFTLQQGLEATQNGFAAQGLGSSGAAIKGAGQYASGLASTTYNQQLQNYMAQNNQTFGMLETLSGSGQNAAAQLGALGNQSVAAQNQLTTAAGAATGAGIVGSANALTSGIGTTASGLQTAALLAGNSGLFSSNSSNSVVPTGDSSNGGSYIV